MSCPSHTPKSACAPALHTAALHMNAAPAHRPEGFILPGMVLVYHICLIDFHPKLLLVDENHLHCRQGGKGWIVSIGATQYEYTSCSCMADHDGLLPIVN